MPTTAPIQILSLLETITAKSIELWVDGDRLMFRDPTNALAEGERENLRRLEAEVLAHLRRGRFVTQTYPLTFGQRSLWFMHQTMRSSPAYNVGLAVKVHAPLDVAAFRLAPTYVYSF